MFLAWQDDDIQYYCASCSFEGKSYNAKVSLQRLEAAYVRGRDSTALLKKAVMQEQLLLQCHDVTFSSVWALSEDRPCYRVDYCSRSILETLEPVKSRYFIPVITQGDGNCFYRALSWAFFGSEREHELIRLLTAIEVIAHCDNYNIKSETILPPLGDVNIITPELNEVIFTTIKLGEYSGLVQAYAASAALDKSFTLFMPSTGCDDVRHLLYSGTISGRGVRDIPQDVPVIMWTSTLTLGIKAGDPRSFRPNHFVFIKQDLITKQDRKSVV